MNLLYPTMDISKYLDKSNANVYQIAYFNLKISNIILDFLTSNDLELKSADGTPENIFFESENKKLYLKLID